MIDSLSDSWTALNTFLGYRYIPDQNPSLPTVIEDSVQVEDLSGTREDLLAQGEDELDTTFEKALSDVDSNTHHVVALSAGLDSRAILAELTDRVDRNQITAVTYGTPGGFNYELAPAVANAVGVEHHRIDISPNTYPWNEETLSKQIVNNEPTMLFRGIHTSFAFYQDQVAKTDDMVCYWNGYLGDPAGGSHLNSDISSWDDALEYFLDSNYEHDNLTATDYNPKDVLPDEPIAPESELSYEEQLDYAIRQTKYIHGNEFESAKTPFATRQWLSFALNIPDEHRTGSRFYKDLLMRKHPQLFSLPTARHYGLGTDAPEYRIKLSWIQKVALPWLVQQLGMNIRHPMMNNFDKNRGLRTDGQFLDFISNQLKDLQSRKIIPWVNPDSLLRRHRRPLNRENYGWEILVLVSLEIYLKSRVDCGY